MVDAARVAGRGLADERLAADPSPDRLREAFSILEAPARAAGHGMVIDGWEPDVSWLRGESRYREG